MKKKFEMSKNQKVWLFVAAVLLLTLFAYNAAFGCKVNRQVFLYQQPDHLLTQPNRTGLTVYALTLNEKTTAALIKASARQGRGFAISEVKEFGTVNSYFIENQATLPLSFGDGIEIQVCKTLFTERIRGIYKQ